MSGKPSLTALIISLPNGSYLHSHVFVTNLVFLLRQCYVIQGPQREKYYTVGAIYALLDSLNINKGFSREWTVLLVLIDFSFQRNR